MRRRDLILAAPSLLLLPGAARAFQPVASLIPAEVGRNIATVRDVVRTGVTARWPGAPEVPFRVLLIAGEHEYLIYRDTAPDGFQPAGRDAATGSPLFVRPRRFPPNLLATFQAVDNVPTIVIGLPAQTDQTDPHDWTVTLLHEHFHQRQYSAPDYAARTAALGLSGGDQTGMWMLNYAFPYQDAAIGAAFAEASRALAAMVRDDRVGNMGAFLAARRRLRAAVPERDWRYFAFQVWQEGVARFAELDLAVAADRREWQASIDRKHARIREDLAAPDLAGKRRVSFYSYGAGEAMLLDRWWPQWRRGYFTGPLSLDAQFDALLASGDWGL